MGCLTVTFSKIGNTIETDFSTSEPIDVEWGAPESAHVQVQPVPPCDVDFERIKTPFSASFGLVCSVGQGAWEYLMCSDKGFVRTFDRGYILVRKR